MSCEAEIVPREGGEALAQAAQSSCGCPIPGSAQGQAGWGWEQPGLGGGGPARARGGTGWASRSLPAQTTHLGYVLVTVLTETYSFLCSISRER